MVTVLKLSDTQSAYEKLSLEEQNKADEIRDVAFAMACALLEKKDSKQRQVTIRQQDNENPITIIVYRGDSFSHILRPTLDNKG